MVEKPSKLLIDEIFGVKVTFSSLKIASIVGICRAEFRTIHHTA